MSNLSTLEMRDNVVNWYKGLTDKEKINLLLLIVEKFIFDGAKFVDEVLTPIYCKLNKIIME